MSKIEFFWNLVGVQRISKTTPEKRTALFVEEPLVADDFGVIAYIGEGIQNPPFAVGDKVYYGKHRQELRMAGKDIFAMEVTNVIARVTEETAPTETETA